ncbi:hypothetical protein BGZ58_000363 [Dissophora ornata]|nr:hypothetical protein BGZ58_000363 [Dissophora ornata]
MPQHLEHNHHQHLQPECPNATKEFEASPTYRDDFETKFMKDKKIARELHDLRCRLDDIPLSTCASEFTVVGFMISGPVLRTMHMSNLGGYVSRLVHHHETFSIASVPAQFPKNLKILRHLLSIKGLLIHSKSILDDVVKGDILNSGLDSDSEPDSSSDTLLRTPLSDQARRAHIPKPQDSPDQKDKKKPIIQVAPVQAFRKRKQRDDEVNLDKSPKAHKMHFT